MDKAKIQLSPKEAELVANADWILTKNGIIEKVKLLLAAIQSEEQDYISKHQLLPIEVTKAPPKISRGENYRGLPYLVLDYPRHFQKNDQMAIRTMFWWGNFFSITLHLSGAYKKHYETAIASVFAQLTEDSFAVSVSEEQWEHHFENSNYALLSSMTQETFNQHLLNKSFIKLAKKIPLEHWNNAPDELFAAFCKLVNWLSN